MQLSETTWRKSGEIDDIGSTFPSFLQFFPDEGFLLEIKPTHKEKGYYLVSGCRYRELGKGRVLILFSPDSPSEASYTLDRDRLIWTTDSGKIFEYILASEDDLPPSTLKYRDLRKREFSINTPLE